MRWQIGIYTWIVQQNNRLVVMIVDLIGVSQFPIAYPDGRITYDNPTMINNTIRAEVRDAWAMLIPPQFWR